MTFSTEPLEYDSYMIKSLKYILFTAIVSFSAFAGSESVSPVKASVEAGYTSAYVVNGLSKTRSEAFTGFDIGSTYYGVDAYIGGTALSSGSGLGDVHLRVGLGRDFSISDQFVLRADILALQHQTVASANSTETRLKVSLDNPYVTPYVIGVYDITLNQSGAIVGLQKTFSVFDLFNVTPAVEYGSLSDYDIVSAKIGVSKVIFGHVEIFGEAAWIDNNFQVKNYNFANREFSGNFVGSGGLRWRF